MCAEFILRPDIDDQRLGVIDQLAYHQLRRDVMNLRRENGCGRGRFSPTQMLKGENEQDSEQLAKSHGGKSADQKTIFYLRPIKSSRIQESIGAKKVPDAKNNRYNTLFCQKFVKNVKIMLNENYILSINTIIRV